MTRRPALVSDRRTVVGRLAAIERVAVPAAAVLAVAGMTVYAAMVGAGLVFDHRGGLVVRCLALLAGVAGLLRREAWGTLLVWLFAGTTALAAFGHAHQAGGAKRLVLVLGGMTLATSCALLWVDFRARRHGSDAD